MNGRNMRKKLRASGHSRATQLYLERSSVWGGSYPIALLLEVQLPDVIDLIRPF
jgi:hypothetical protein